MSTVLIATLYSFEPIVASATKISASRLFLLVDHEPDEKQQKSIGIIEQSLGSVLEIKKVKTDVYDIVKVAEETVRIIDLLSDRDSIYIDVTAGRKTKALGLLFGSYARSDRIKRIMYVREENKEIMNLPKLSYSITPGQLKIIEYLMKTDVKSMSEFSEKIDLSRAQLYQSIKQLKDMDIIEETKDGFIVTDYGKIVVL
jgi:CRISPR-associated protein Csa3